MNAEVTAFWRGRLQVWQPPRGGYRFGLDSVLLARFCPPARSVCDLGAGCGIIGLLLLCAGKARQVSAIERQGELAELACRNAAGNGFAGRMRVIQADLREQSLPRHDLVVFNPPYFRRGEGRSCGHPQREAARREHWGTLHDFAARAVASLTSRGLVATVVRPDRGGELIEHLGALGLTPRLLRPVAPRAGTLPRALMMLFGRASGPCRRLSAWSLHPASGPWRFAAGLRGWIERGA